MALTHLQLPAKIIMPNGHIFVPVVMRIVSRDEQNIPIDLLMIPMDTPIEMVPGDEYMISYVIETMVSK